MHGYVSFGSATYESSAIYSGADQQAYASNSGSVNGSNGYTNNIVAGIENGSAAFAGIQSYADADYLASGVMLYSSTSTYTSATYNALTVDATGVKVNGNALLSTGDLQPYARLSGATFTGNVSVAGTAAANGLANSGEISTDTLKTTGLATLDSATVTNNATVGGTLGVTGATMLSSTLSVAGASTLNGTTTINSTLGVTGVTSINAAGAAATTIGANSNSTSLNSSIVNIGAGTYSTTVTLGSAQSGTRVTAAGGNSQLSVTNNKAELRSGTGTASNGKLGTGALIGGGGFASYANAQTVTNGSTVGNLLEGTQYVNRINGNALIDGNLYINGTLNYVSSNAANTAVLGSGVQTSNLAGATQATSGGTAVVMKGATASQAVVDANGKIFDTASTSIADQSTAALTLTNGLGNTHGVVVTESQATLSGGNLSTSMTLNDNGARFSNSATGAPVTVTGVADGRSDFDAVNLRQFAGAVASVAAMTNIPGVDTNKQASVGVGLGNFMGHSALALGGNYRFSSNGVFKASVATGLNSGGSQAAVGLGAGWSW